MEATQMPDKTESHQTPQEKNVRDGQMEQGDNSQVRVSGSRCTRSQVAPDWTVEDMLILVNEIAAVEADCSNALSTYQRWKIISENCTALDVPRSLNQCRRKWGSLLVEYNQIKQWESLSSGSYWSLGIESRKQFGLPDYFDYELFKAIDNVVRAQEDKADTDPESDPDAETDTLEIVAQLGSNGPTRRLNIMEQKPHEIRKEDTKLKWCTEKSHPGRKPQKSSAKKKLLKNDMKGKRTISIEAKEQTVAAFTEAKEQSLAAKLQESAELIHAIVKENLSEKAKRVNSTVKNAEEFKTDVIRRQGNRLIACLGVMIESLNQICDVVQNGE